MQRLWRMQLHLEGRRESGVSGGVKTSSKNAASSKFEGGNYLDWEC
jgi:hypothetical protein